MLCLFEDVILEGNKFLSEVLEKKLVERFPMSYESMVYLAKKGVLSSECSNMLLEKIKKSMTLFSQLKKKDEEKLCEVILLIEKKNKITWPSDEWIVKGNKKAVEIFGREWSLDKSLLDGVKRKMKAESQL